MEEKTLWHRQENPEDPCPCPTHKVLRERDDFLEIIRNMVDEMRYRGTIKLATWAKARKAVEDHEGGGAAPC